MKLDQRVAKVSRPALVEHYLHAVARSGAAEQIKDMGRNLARRCSFYDIHLSQRQPILCLISGKRTSRAETTLPRFLFG